MTFSAPKKQKGDLLKSEDWNAAMAEIERLGEQKLNSNEDDIFKGSLTVEGAIKITPKIDISPSLSVSGSIAANSLSIGEFLSVDGNNKTLRLGEVEIKSFSNNEFLSSDGSLQGSELSIPTEKAVKSYINYRLRSIEDGFNVNNLSVMGKLSARGVERLEMKPGCDIIFDEAGGMIGPNHQSIIRFDINKYGEKQIRIESESKGGIYLKSKYYNDGTKVIINHKGVGIDQYDPSAKLDVKGDVKVEGKLFANQVKIEDGYPITGGEKLQIIRGGFDGNFPIGSGFTGEKIKIQYNHYYGDNTEGGSAVAEICKIKFNQPFISPPLVLLSPRFKFEPDLTSDYYEKQFAVEEAIALKYQSSFDRNITNNPILIMIDSKGFTVGNRDLSRNYMELYQSLDEFRFDFIAIGIRSL